MINVHVNYLDSIPCFTSPLILLNTSAIPIPIFPAIISAVFSRVLINGAFGFIS